MGNFFIWAGLRDTWGITSNHTHTHLDGLSHHQSFQNFNQFLTTHCEALVSRLCTGSSNKERERER